MIPPYPHGTIVNMGVAGRAVFGSKARRRMQKGPENTPASVFLDSSSPTRISVFLLNMVADSILTKIGDSMASQRVGNRTFCGWAEVTVKDASKNNRKVCATPQPANKWHADIVLPLTTEQDKKERERHVNELAKMAIPRWPDR